MANTPSRPDTPYPLLARVQAGPVHDSLHLIWDAINTIRNQLASAGFSIGTSAIASVGLSAVQSIPDSTPTVISWTKLLAQSTVAADSGSISAGFPSRLNFPRDTPQGPNPDIGSVWLATADIAFDTNGTGRRKVELLYTEPGVTTTLLGAVTATAVTGDNTILNLVVPVLNPAPGAYLEIQVEQTSGAPLDIAIPPTTFTLLRLF